MECAACDDCQFDGKTVKGIPYEIHITVKADDVDRFKSVCVELGVKPLLIDMDVMTDMMTSSKFVAKNADIDNVLVFKEMSRVGDGLRACGFTVTREKIEAAPWHPDVPTDAGYGMALYDSQYFECHLAIASPSGREAVERAIGKLGMHLSKNRLKRDDGGKIWMATVRKRDITLEAFKFLVSKMKGAIEHAGLRVEREIIEFAWFDSNWQHDAAWIET